MPPRNQMQKQRAKMLSADPATRTIHGVLKDGSKISIAVFEVPSNFRWPAPEEIWTIYRENQYWMLGSRVHTPAEDFAVEDMEQGEMRLDSDSIKDSQGRKIFAVEHGEEVVAVPAPSVTDGDIPDGAIAVRENGKWVTKTIQDILSDAGISFS